MSKSILPKVSIIIPVYNASKEMFDVSINSVLNQTYKNLDIIIVDDGSTNGIQDYCDELRNIDNRIRVIHQENQGVSVARNRGTEEAEGDYVMYVDADDIAADFMVESAVKTAKKMDADLVIGLIEPIWDYSDFVADRCNEEYYIDVEKLKKRILAIIEQEELLEIKWNGKFGRESYVKLIRTELAKQIKFPDGVIYGEDVIWLLRLLNLCNNVFLKNETWYGYLQYESSSVYKFNEKRLYSINLFNELLIKENSELIAEYPQVMIKYMYSEIIMKINYHYLSRECPLSLKRKNKEIRDSAIRYEKMFSGETRHKKNMKQKALIFICKTGLWFPVFKLWSVR